MTDDQFRSPEVFELNDWFAGPQERINRHGRLEHAAWETKLRQRLEELGRRTESGGAGNGAGPPLTPNPTSGVAPIRRSDTEQR